MNTTVLENRIAALTHQVAALCRALEESKPVPLRIGDKLRTNSAIRYKRPDVSALDADEGSVWEVSEILVTGKDCTVILRNDAGKEFRVADEVLDRLLRRGELSKEES
jgi:hypothetical protein